MNDLATFRRFAEDCLRLAEIGPEEDRRILLEHAVAWAKLAEEPVRHHAPSSAHITPNRRVLLQR